MSISTSLFDLANELTSYAELDSPEIDLLIEVAKEVGKSWSGSWLGYHSLIYYEGFKTPPPGARFSQEWGFMPTAFPKTTGDWHEFSAEAVLGFINKKANQPNIDKITSQHSKAEKTFEHVKSSALSLIHSSFQSDKDKFLKGMVDKVESCTIYVENDYLRKLIPSGQMMSRDIIAAEKGVVVPPHVSIIAIALAAKSPYSSCAELKMQIEKLASHIQNLEKKIQKKGRTGTNIFIGHGRSPYWRELKDFVSDRLCLPWDEFNGVPIAGIHNITRLVEMLDHACFAFLIMTAEDELADGSRQARMNVIHEVGLFQGRLGFERAIVLLEEGCEEFSNIHGLGQIRFAKGKISGVFDEVRQVLEREGIVESNV